MTERYDIDDAIKKYIEEHDDGDGITETELVDAVCPRPKNHSTYALVLLRLQQLHKRGDLYSPTPERKWRKL